MSRAARWLDEVQAAMHRAHPDAAIDDLVARWARRGHRLSPSEVLGLRFHVRSGRNRRVRFLKLGYPSLWQATPEPVQPRLIARWLATPASADPDWAEGLAGFVDVVAAVVRAGTLPPAAVELAAHDRHLARARRAPPPGPPAVDPSRLAVNPTLDVLAVAHDWPAWWAKRPRPDWPDPVQPPPNLAYFQHPATHKARWRPLSEPVLAALRVVSESTPAPEAARAAGLSVDALQARLMAYAEDGWLVARA